MDDIRIPCIVWFHGDPPPDLSGISDPIRIPFTLRSRAVVRSDLPTDYHAVAPGSFTEAQGGPPLHVEESPAIVHPPVEQFRTDASNPSEPESRLPNGAHTSPAGPRGNGRAPHTCGSHVFDLQHRPPSDTHYDYLAPDESWYNEFQNGDLVPYAHVPNTASATYPVGLGDDRRGHDCSSSSQLAVSPITQAMTGPMQTTQPTDKSTTIILPELLDLTLDSAELRVPAITAALGSMHSLSAAAQTIRLAAAGDLSCQGFSGGCQNGGDWGTTAAYGISGRNLCMTCAVKLLGVQDESASEKTMILRPFLLPGN